MTTNVLVAVHVRHFITLPIKGREDVHLGGWSHGREAKKEGEEVSFLGLAESAREQTKKKKEEEVACLPEVWNRV